MARSKEISNVFENEESWTQSNERVNVTSPQRVPWIPDFSSAKVREALARWATDNDICRRHVTQNPLCDVAAENICPQVVSPEGRGFDCSLFNRSNCSETGPTESFTKAAGASKEIDHGRRGSHGGSIDGTADKRR
ncbi:cytosine-specific methyltransferase domain protein [Mycobacterium xenopi 4042]|uniref:Cytosine-specific methyltransferase domain protein n=1 Tax=Mycobacterium xenopi 4042 TaxID=1299334 RepID=X8CAE4_MYCXE|nr:cytosine-specific methyltransferase domain protein [Mycobacterium xenopi 3993]EUA52270.1 cytosine-specific methyltransferase domain protein [Mycobacterium xenopi 4042]